MERVTLSLISKLLLVGISILSISAGIGGSIVCFTIFIILAWRPINKMYKTYTKEVFIEQIPYVVCFARFIGWTPHTAKNSSPYFISK